MTIKSFVIILTLTFFVSTGHAQWVQTAGPQGGSITAIAVLDGDVFAGTTSGLFRSVDTGAHWSRVTSGKENTSIRALAILNGNVFASTNIGMLRSSDTGLSWQEADAGSKGGPMYLEAVGNDLFALFGYGVGVFRSTDLGMSWTPIDIDSTVNSMASIGGYFFAAGGGIGVSYSPDSGVTWITAADAGLPDPYIFNLTAIGTTLFVADVASGLFRSTDSGATWNPASTGNEGFGVNTLAANGADLYSAADAGFYCSSDNGSHWAQESSPAGSVQTIGFLGSILLAGTWSSGLFISNNGASSWQPIDSGMVITDVTSLSVQGPDIFANCGQSSASSSDGVFVSIDGEGWTDITANLNSYLPVIAIAAYGGDVFAVTEGPAVYVSMDSGMTWNTSSNLGSLAITAIFPTSNALFATSGSGIFESTDEGTTWLGANSGIAANDIDMLSFAQGPSALFCGSTNGAVYYSSNNGMTWNNIAPPDSYDSIEAIALVDGNIVAGGGEGLFVSSDGGTTWTDAFIADNGITSLLTVQSSIFAGTSGGIFVSTDGANTWNAENQGLATLSVNALAVQGSDLYAGTEGGGVWHRPLSQMINFDAVQAVGVLPAIEQNYPNPFTRQTTIPFSIAQTEHVTIKIFNILGEQIATPVDQDFGVGTHEVVWDAGSFPSGNYVCRITTLEGTQTEPLVLVSGGSR